MIFTARGLEYICEDYDYDDLVIDADDKIIGVIRKSEDGYYRFYPNEEIAITAGMLKRLLKKIVELNSVVIHESEAQR